MDRQQVSAPCHKMTHRVERINVITSMSVWLYHEFISENRRDGITQSNSHNACKMSKNIPSRETSCGSSAGRRLLLSENMKEQKRRKGLKLEWHFNPKKIFGGNLEKIWQKSHGWKMQWHRAGAKVSTDEKNKYANREEVEREMGEGVNSGVMGWMEGKEWTLNKGKINWQEKKQAHGKSDDFQSLINVLWDPTCSFLLNKRINLTIYLTFYWSASLPDL